MSDRIVVNAGGRRFETTIQTLVASGCGYFQGLLGPTGSFFDQSNKRKRDAYEDSNESSTSSNEGSAVDVQMGRDNERKVQAAPQPDSAPREVYLDCDPDLFAGVLHFMRRNIIAARVRDDKGVLADLKSEAEFLAFDALCNACDEAISCVDRDIESARKRTVEEVVSCVRSECEELIPRMVREAFEEASGELSQGVDALRGDFTSKLDESRDEMEGKLNATKEKIDEVQEQIYNAMEEMKTVCENKLDEAKEAVEETKDGISSEVNSAKDDLEEAVDDMKNDFKEKMDEVKDAMVEMKEDVSGGVNSVKDNLEEAVNDMKDDVKEKLGEVKDAVEEAKDDLEKAVHDAKRSIEYKVDDVKDDTEEALSDMKEEVESGLDNVNDEINFVVNVLGQVRREAIGMTLPQVPPYFHW